MHALLRGERGGGSFRRLQKPCQTALGILLRLTVPGGTVADLRHVMSIETCRLSLGTGWGNMKIHAPYLRVPRSTTTAMVYF